MKFLVARAAKHMWEEPLLSGTKGSGTIFFSSCFLKCVYCQNYEISHANKGIYISDEQLANLMLYLQDQGVHNINLVTPSHYARPLVEVLNKVKSRLHIPVVYNTSGYDKVETLKQLDGLVDIYLPDIKYFSNECSLKYSGVADYFDVASKALIEMRRQQPKDIMKNKIMQSGVIVRHLVLPSLTNDSLKIMEFISSVDKSLYVSIMAQYFPTNKANKYNELNRRISKQEYDTVCKHFFKLGLKNGFMQELDSAIEDYVPEFDLDLMQQIVLTVDSNYK